MAGNWALLKGRETSARRVIAVTMIGGAVLAVVHTAGFPPSVSSPILLLPAITFSAYTAQTV